MLPGTIAGKERFQADLTVSMGVELPYSAFCIGEMPCPPSISP
jgi:hypothetical protein